MKKMIKILLIIVLLISVYTLENIKLRVNIDFSSQNMHLLSLMLYPVILASIGVVLASDFKVITIKKIIFKIMIVSLYAVYTWCSLFVFPELMTYQLTNDVTILLYVLSGYLLSKLLDRII